MLPSTGDDRKIRQHIQYYPVHIMPGYGLVAGFSGRPDPGLRGSWRNDRAGFFSPVKKGNNSIRKRNSFVGERVIGMPYFVVEVCCILRSDRIRDEGIPGMFIQHDDLFMRQRRPVMGQVIKDRVPVFFAKRNHMDDVVDAVGKAELSAASPGAAVIEIDDVPAMRPHRLSDIEIAFIAGKAMQEEHRRMFSRTVGAVNKARQLRVTGRDE
jgi:hypothetical protein